MKMETNTSAFALAVAILSGPTLAQQATETAAPPVASMEEIVVTGSNIKGASDSGPIAVSVLNVEQLEVFGVNFTGELFENIA